MRTAVPILPLPSALPALLLAMLGGSAPAQAVLLERAPLFPASKHETRSLAAGDIDGDGDLDLVLGNVGRTVLWLNRGGVFVEAAPDATPRQFFETNSMALRDLDGDGDLDLFLANGGWFGGSNCLWLNDGSGRFVDANYRLPQDYAWSNSVAAGDLDGDGDVDLLLGRFNRSVLLLNDGKANFAPTQGWLPDVKTATMVVALGDVDGDGDLDAVLGNFLYERNRLWRNDGRGRFEDVTEQQLPDDQDDTLALALGDVDGDGDLDLVCGNGRLGGEQPKLYCNDGAGRFTDVTAAVLPAVRCETHALALLDLDGDGDRDLLLGNADGAVGGSSLLWLNDGRGRFAPAPAGAWPAAVQRTTCLMPVDVDGDGRPELVVGNGREGGEQSVVLRLPQLRRRAPDGK